MVDSSLTRMLSTLATVYTADGHSDGVLLERFLDTNDEAAITALIERHGPMVRGVCHRFLRNPHDADDACQATFLVLARRADSLRRHESLASWLHGIAARVAANLRRENARRSRRERDRNRPDERAPESCGPWQDVLTALDEELQRLPERYRAPLILCYLEGLTRDEAAGRLRLTSGTLHGRLERGRSLLRKNLVRRGLSFSAGLLAVVLGEAAAASPLSPAMVVTTSRAAREYAGGGSVAAGLTPNVLSCTREVLNMLTVTKVKVALAVLLAAVLTCAGIGMCANAVPAAGPSEPQKGAPLFAVGGRGEHPFARAKVREAAPVPKAKPVPPRQLVVSSNDSGNWEIYLVNPDTREAKNITNHKANDTEPAWAPDGKRIAFVSDRGGAAEIWLMNADGTEPKRLTEKATPHSDLRWSPDGKRIAFVRANDGLKNVSVAETEDGKVVQVTNEKFACRGPVWAPDGKRLAYGHYPDEGRWGVQVINADGTEKRDLTGPKGGVGPVWSPDGKRIAFTSLRSDLGFQVYTIGADGDDVRDLATVPSPVVGAVPQWSPDGESLVFAEWDRVGSKVQVATVRADGTGHQILTTNAAHSHARWSPDGKSLSYGQFTDDHGYFRDTQAVVLIVSDADGKNPRELMKGYRTAEWRPR